MAASRATDALVPILLIISCLAALMSCVDRITEIMNTAVPIRRETFLLSSTKPVRARVMFVISRPRIVTASVRKQSSTKSPVFRRSFRENARSRSPSFLWGSGA